MEGRPYIVADIAGDIAMPRKAMRVKRVCEILDCGCAEVYRLIRQGELEAFNVGGRSKRIYVDSLADYQNRQRVTPTQARHQCAPVQIKRRSASTAAYRSAIVEAERLGILPK